MGNKIVTEADRKATPAPKPLPGMSLPTAGRDREAWSRRMIAHGTLAGGLYALRGDFVERIR